MKEFLEHNGFYKEGNRRYSQDGNSRIMQHWLALCSLSLRVTTEQFLLNCRKNALPKIIYYSKVLIKVLMLFFCTKCDEQKEFEKLKTIINSIEMHVIVFCSEIFGFYNGGL